jgi:hypothetical protein
MSVRLPAMKGLHQEAVLQEAVLRKDWLLQVRQQEKEYPKQEAKLQKVADVLPSLHQEVLRVDVDLPGQKNKQAGISF